MQNSSYTTCFKIFISSKLHLLFTLVANLKYPLKQLDRDPQKFGKMACLRIPIYVVYFGRVHSSLLGMLYTHWINCMSMLVHIDIQSILHLSCMIRHFYLDLATSMNSQFQFNLTINCLHS